VTCDSIRPTTDPGAPTIDGGGPFIECRSHAECTDGVNGRCGGNGHDGWYCTYDQCTTDSECLAVTMGLPAVCACEGGFRSDANVCLTGNCRTDADCPGQYCSPSFGSCGAYTGVSSYYCHTPGDECVDDADCGGDGGYGSSYCMYSPVAGHWMCSNSHCVG